MHPTTHLRQEIEALRAELAALRAAVQPQKLEPVIDPTKPVLKGAAFHEPGGLDRKKDGTPFFEGADTRPYEVRNAEAQAAHKAAEAATLAKMKEGCPAGTYRDWSGQIRDLNTGKLRPDLMKIVTGPQNAPTEPSPPSPLRQPVKLLHPHVEQIAAGQDPDAVCDPDEELRRLRKPEAQRAAAPIPEPVAKPSTQIDVPPDPIMTFHFTAGA